MKRIVIIACMMPMMGVHAQQNNTLPTECLASCTMPDQYQTEIVTYYIYTGDKEEAPFTQKVEVDLAPTKTVWKKMPDPNCPSGTPEDCMIWTPTESQGEKLNLTIVTNIEKQGNYITEQFSRTKLVREGGFQSKCAIVCEEDLSPSLMYNVSMRLTDLGYYSGLIYSVMNGKIKNALNKFQEHNGLPVGHLNKATVEALELDWPYPSSAATSTLQPEQ